MNPNDKTMLEKVKPGWWVKHNDTGPAQYEASRDKWCLIGLGWCNSDVRRPPYITATCPENWDSGVDMDIELSAGDILALHAPTDDPQMATAYLMGEPEEVTREEAARMVFAVGSVYEDWDWQDDEADIWMPSYSEDDINIAASVRSPGGNVYKIRD